MAKNNGKKRKLPGKLEESIDRILKDIQGMPNVSKLNVGDFIKVSSKWRGPGFYFMKQDDYKHNIPLIVMGRTPKVGLQTNILPNGSRDSTLKDLVQYRLDGCYFGFVSSDETINDMIKQFEYLPSVERVIPGDINQRSEPWKGPGVYHLGLDSQSKSLKLLAMGQKSYNGKKPSAGRKVEIVPRRGYHHVALYEIGQFGV